MGMYLYQSPKTGKIIEVYQKMTEDHVYSENGIDFNRVFTSPNAAIDTQYDVRNPKDFVAKTSNKKGSIGSLWDQAQEASLAREAKDGVDFIKEKYYKDYSKKRGGKVHSDVKKKELNSKLNKLGVSVDF